MVQVPNDAQVPCLLSGWVDVDPAFHVVWSRFRMMRRFLAWCPEEEPKIFRMLDLFSGELGVVGLFIYFLSLLLSLDLLGMEMRKVGFGSPSLPCV